MDSKAIRTIVIFGVMASVALAFLMMFSLDQMTDTQTPQIAAEIAREFAPALKQGPPASVRVTMSRDGKGVDARRVYNVRIRPSAAVEAEDQSLMRLVYHCSEMCAAGLGSVRGEVVIRCVAELSDGAQKEAIFVVDPNGQAGGIGLLRPVAEMPAHSAPTEVAASPVPSDR